MIKEEYTLSLIDDVSFKLDNISKKLEETDKKMEDTGKSGDKAFTGFNKDIDKALGNTKVMGVSLSSLLNPTTAAVAAVGLLAAGIIKCTEAAREDALAQNRLSATLGYTSTALIQQSEELANRHKLTSGEIVNVQRLTANYFDNEDAISKLTPAIMNMSIATGESTEAITSQLSGAIKSGRGLKQYGVDLSDCKNEEERLTKITEFANKRFSDQATAVTDLRSPISILGSDINELAGTFGGLFLSIEKSDAVKNWVNDLSEGLRGIKDLINMAFPTTTQDKLYKKQLELMKLNNKIYDIENQPNKNFNNAILNKYKKDAEKLQIEVDALKKSNEKEKDDAAKAKAEADRLAKNKADAETAAYKKNNKEEKKKPTQDTMTSDYRSYNWGMGPPVELVEQNWDAIAALQLRYSQLGMNKKQKELDDEKRRYQEELEAAGVTDELKQAALEVHRQKIQEINDHYDEIEKEKTEKLEEEKNKIRQTYQVAAIDAAQQISNAIFSIAQQSADREANREIKKINGKYDGNKKLTKAEKEKEKEIEKVQKEAFEKGKKRAVAQALIDGALGAAKTVATLGWPAAIPMLIVQGITTAAQIAVITSQKFARGGVVRQEPGIPSTGDNHLVGVNPGEIILTPEQFSNLRSGAGSTSGGQIVNFQTTLNLSGQINNAVMDRLEETLEDHREKIREDLRVLQTSGRISGITFE